MITKGIGIRITEDGIEHYCSFIELKNKYFFGLFTSTTRHYTSGDSNETARFYHQDYLVKTWYNSREKALEMLNHAIMNEEAKSKAKNVISYNEIIFE